MLVAIGIATGALLVPNRSTGASSGPAILPIPAASPAALSAANKLLADPWAGLLTSIEANAAASLSKLDGTKIGPSFTVKGFKVQAVFVLDDAKPSLSISSPPGFTASGPGGFSLRAPLNGTWNLGMTGTLTGNISAKAAGQRLVSATSPPLPFSLTLSNLSLAAAAKLDTTASPVKLTSATIDVNANVGGSLLFPKTPLHIQFARAADGVLTASVALTRASISVGGVGVDWQNVLTIKLLPHTNEAFGDTIFYAYIYLGGALALHLPAPIHTVSVPFDAKLFGIFPVPMPHDQAGELSFAGRGSIPNVWPPGAPASGQVAPQTLDFSSLANTLENGISATHMPFGTVFSIDYPSTQSSPLSDQRPFSYGLEADSTIWTGHYLAAEAFRYAKTHDRDALTRVQTLIAGIRGDFEETKDAVVTGPAGCLGQLSRRGTPTAPPSNKHCTYAPVPTSIAGKVFARTTMPGKDSHNWTEPYQARVGHQCLYVKASGWTVGGHTYNNLTLGEVLARQSGRSLVGITPVNPVYGTGCGSNDADNPTSRDQYSGIFMGLAYAWALVPEVRDQVTPVVDTALEYLLDNGWDVPLAPNTRVVRTSFLGNFDAQISLLRIGATIDPGRFQGRYDQVKDASALAWIPVWFSTIDPIFSYFKFNLDHAFLGPALFLPAAPNENDGTTVQNLLAAYSVVRGPTVSHRNAWFDLVDLLVHGPWQASDTPPWDGGLTTGQEIQSDLGDWQTRWSYDKNQNGDEMPTNDTSAQAAQQLTSYWLTNRVAGYSNGLGESGSVVSSVVPLQYRTGDGMDFVWQKGPFGPGVDASSSKRTEDGYKCGSRPPTWQQIRSCSSAHPRREGSGIDFLLPYWVAVYLGVLPRS